MKNIYCLFLIFAVVVFASFFTQAATHTITVADFQFTPDTMTIEPGDTITWQWINGIHTTTSNGIPSGAAPWNALLDSMHTSFTYIATEPGTYHYISVPDLPSMTGTFTIPGAEVGIDEVALSPVTFDLVSNLVHDQVFISYTVHTNAIMDLALYNISGMRLQTLLHEKATVGKYQSSFYLQETFPAGMYFIRMQSGSSFTTKRMMIQ
ncbi:MAG TPA: T9SS type A sorting domain-containing protein [Chitinophagales bacterium]|nr:T9SS type A sorting domain-containing protein [Chitinophagales bacterium]